MQRDPVRRIFNSRIPAIVNLITPCVELTVGSWQFYRNPEPRVPGWLIRHADKHTEQWRRQGWRYLLRIAENEAEAREAERNSH